MAGIRFGVAARLNGGLLALTTLMIGAGVYALISTEALHVAADRMTGSYLPTLITTSLLAQQSQSVVANAPSLVVADQHAVRRSVADRIVDQTAGLDALLSRLENNGVPAVDLAGIRSLTRMLTANFREMDAAVGRRLDHDRATRAALERVARLPARLRAVADSDDPAIDAPATDAWLTEAEYVVAQMLATPQVQSVRRVEDIGRDVAARLDSLDTLTGRLPEPAAGRARPLLKEMRAVAAGDGGLFSHQAALARSMIDVEQTLFANREIANDFMAAVGKEVQSVESRALDTGAGLSHDVARSRDVLLVVFAVGLAAAAVIIMYVNRGVIRRLVDVRDSMLGHMPDRPLASLAPGRDEIADIAQALDVFVRVIHHRESDLLSAKEAAERVVAELRQTQENLIQAQKMAALGTLVAGVAHEINTPVGIALSCASHLADATGRLQRDVEGGALGRRDFGRYMQTAADTTALIAANCERAAQLISSFKSIAVDRRGREWRRFDLVTCVRDVLISVQPRLQAGGHAITVEGPDEMIIESDPTAVAQILTNLLMNTVLHAYDDGQSGRIRIAMARLGAAGDVGRQVEIVYADDGKGIAEEVRDRVFEPFVTTRRGSGATGLGLHIVHNLVVETLRGSVAMTSAVGIGTAFTLRIPIATDDRQARRA